MIDRLDDDDAGTMKTELQSRQSQSEDPALLTEKTALTIMTTRGGGVVLRLHHLMYLKAAIAHVHTHTVKLLNWLLLVKI